MSRCEYNYYVTLLPCNQFHYGDTGGQSSHRGWPPDHPLQPLLLLLHPHTHLPLQQHLPIFRLSGLHLNQKYLRFFSSVLTSSLTPIRSLPGFWMHVLKSLLLPLPTLSICLSPQVSSNLFSKNPLSPHFSSKPTLDKDQLSNYRPISNLSLISKIIKHVVKCRLTDHLVSNGLLNHHQSAYCKHHSSETALLYIHDHLINNNGSQKLKVKKWRSSTWYSAPSRYGHHKGAPQTNIEM